MDDAQNDSLEDNRDSEREHGDERDAQKAQPKSKGHDYNSIAQEQEGGKSQKREEEPCSDPSNAKAEHADSGKEETKDEDVKTFSIIKALDSGHIELSKNVASPEPSAASKKDLVIGPPQLKSSAESDDSYISINIEASIPSRHDIAPDPPPLRAADTPLVSPQPHDQDQYQDQYQLHDPHKTNIDEQKQPEKGESHKEDVSGETTHIEIVGYLGSGGEGQVYLGKIANLNELVALKRFEVKTDQQEGRRLFDLLSKEVELVKSLNHPNIIKYYKLHRSNSRRLQVR